MSKALVTGSAGFVGIHLKRELEAQGIEVIDYNLRDGANLLNYEFMRNVLDIQRPDYIYHLAAQAFVPESLSDPIRTFQVNTLGSLNLLEAVKRLGLKSQILLVGTSEEYGNAQVGDGVITENTLPVPMSPYAISKQAMDQLGMMYARAYSMEVVVTRAFNHSGPGRGEMYAESSWAKQIVEIELGQRESVSHGNLTTMRNYTDVRDIVKAYIKAIGLPPAVYNICSPTNISMKAVLDTLCELSGIDVPLIEDPGLFRPGDFSFRVPSAKRFTKLTGWKPEYKFRDTMNDLLNYWREKLNADS